MIRKRIWINILAILCAAYTLTEMGSVRAEAAVQRQTFYEDGDVVGFIGDSITHATYTPLNYVETLYQYYVSRFPRRKIEFRNLSAAGYKVEDVLNIYDQDPAFDGISKAVIMLGTNEAILDIPSEEYIANMERLIERLKEDGLQGGDIMILSPPICDQDCAGNYDKNGRPRWNFEGRLVEYLELLETKTREWGVGYVDLHNPMLELTRKMQKENQRNSLTTDCIHPDAVGQILIAYYILQAQGAEEEALAEIYLPKEGLAQTVGGELADLYRGEKELCWIWKPERLPAAVTDELRKFWNLIETGGTLCRQSFRIEGLSEDKIYRISVGETELGAFSGKELGEGLVCEEPSRHPLWEVVGQIEARCRKRHKEAVKYRNMWIEVMMQRAVYTPEQIQAEYENWRRADETLRNEISAMAREAADSLFFVSVTEDYTKEELETEAKQPQKEAEEQSQKEAEEQSQKEAEEQARKEAEEQNRKEAEKQNREEAEEQNREEAEEQNRKEAEEQSWKEAEKQIPKEENARKTLRRELVGGLGAAVLLILISTVLRKTGSHKQQ